jgi:hypothetical protein
MVPPLIARKFDRSKRRSYPGRPPIDGETETLIVRMARENSGWGYDRIVGALANLGSDVGSDGGERAQAVGHRTATESVPEDHLEETL